MKVPQLRNHIPIAAPARREPAEGDEGPLRLSLGFEPTWFHLRCGVDFSENWHRNPVSRYESLATMQRELCRSFPEVDQWKEGDPRDLATVSGCYGAYLVPAVFGMSLEYAADRWPVLQPGQELSVADVEALDADRVLQSPVVEDLFRQMDTINERWGCVYGYLNWQGVLNSGFHLRGQEIFMDLVDRPELARQLFATITELVVRLAQLMQARQRRSGFAIDQLSVSNCTVNMISPRMYEDFILPCDTRIAESFPRFGVHTCNWDITPYISALAKLPKVGYLDMGTKSNLAKVRERFPDARRAVLYTPGRVGRAAEAEIREDLERIWRDLAPCDLVVADIPHETPDEAVQRFVRIAGEVEEER